MRFGKGIVVASFCMMLIISGIGVALAQDYPSWAYVSETTDPLEIIILENDYIQAKFGKGGKIKAYLNDNKTISSSEQTYLITGRWAICAGKVGDPEVTGDEYREINYFGQYAPCNDFGCWRLKVGDTMYLVGDTGTGSWVKKPELFSPPVVGTGTKGAYIEGLWAITDTNIRIRLRLSLVRDQVRFEQEIINMGTSTQNVGLELCGDVEVRDPTLKIGNIYSNYEYYYSEPDFTAYVEGTGENDLVYDYAKFYSGTNVPDYFEVYDNIPNPITVTRNTLNLEDATKPDYVAIGEYHEDTIADTAGDLGRDVWIPTDYSPNYEHPIQDPYWILCWDQKALKPGSAYSRKIVTYYGLGAATTKWTKKSGKSVVQDTVALAVQGPRTLTYDSTNVSVDTNELSPTSFTIKAYVYNLDNDQLPTYLISDASAFLTLPAGLELASGETAKKEIGAISYDSECTPVEWQVRATGEYCGKLQYSVSVTDSGNRHWQQTVTSSIIVPASKRSLFTYGWQLMHIPFCFNDSRIDYVLGLDQGTFTAKYYDKSGSKAVYKALTNYQPGQAFWIYVNGLSWGKTQSLVLPIGTDAWIYGGDTTQSVGVSIDLTTGYNLIGNPLLYPIYLGALRFQSSNSTDSVDFDTAISYQWIKKTIFSWNPSKWAYDISSAKTTLLNPWKGYWIYAEQPVTIQFIPQLFPGGNILALNGGY